MLPTLLGKPTQQKQHEHLYFQWTGKNPGQMVRRGDWKLIRWLSKKTPQLELYNIGESLEEQKNLAIAYPELVRELRALIDQEHAENEHFPLPDME